MLILKKSGYLAEMKKQEDMRVNLNNEKIKFFIGDVRDYDSIYNAMNGVNFVFHAAALKQVPSCEFYPMEAVKTNIIGADNVISAAIKRKVERVVVLSTDKALHLSMLGNVKSNDGKVNGCKSSNAEK